MKINCILFDQYYMVIAGRSGEDVACFRKSTFRQVNGKLYGHYIDIDLKGTNTFINLSRINGQ